MCVVEEKIVLAQSIMEMELEIVTGILISFAHVHKVLEVFIMER